MGRAGSVGGDHNHVHNVQQRDYNTECGSMCGSGDSRWDGKWKVAVSRRKLVP